MGILSSIFGKSKEEKALKEVLEHIRRILEDEEFQVECIHPSMRDIIKSKPAYDVDPDGTGPFGYVVTNPIPTNGPIGELSYLSSLETLNGERIIFHRLGAINTIDAFEAVTFSGSEWFIFFVDYYHPKKSKLSPEGFRFYDGVSQLSGFNKFSQNFPFDFVDMKHAEQQSGLSMAYIAVDKITTQLEKNSFERPLSHKLKLDLINSKLTSRQNL